MLAAMQDGHFLLSALQPETGVCSLALPSDLQLDRRGAEGPEAERLRAARVQEQVRARLLQLGQLPRHNGAAEPDGAVEVTRGRWTPAGWAPPGMAEAAAMGVVEGESQRPWRGRPAPSAPAWLRGSAPDSRALH